MASTELVFTVLGPSGAGKTTLLACMQKKFDDLMPGSIVADRAAFSTLKMAYQKLEDEANSSELEFGVGIENTENLREYSFTITASKANIPMRFYDFPGGWMNKSQSENYSRVVDILRRSRVIFIAVNTPYLMEANGGYRNEARVEETVSILKKSLLGVNDNRLVLILPIKCEKYTKNNALMSKMYSVIEGAFADVLALAESPSSRKRLAVAMMPVHTVGNATFSRFESKDGRLAREIYLKNRSTKFSPKYVDQPLRYALSFLLNEFARGGDAGLNDSLSRADFRELCSFIRDGMEVNNGLFKFYSGKELVTDSVEIKRVPEPPKPPVPKPPKPQVPEPPVTKPKTDYKMIAIVILLIVIVILLLHPGKIVVVTKHQTFWEWVWSLF